MGKEISMTQVIHFKQPAELTQALSHFDLSLFSGKSVLVKLHMGEKNNRFYPRPDFVKLVIDQLKSIDAAPFLYDTTVLYNSPRKSVSGYHKVAKSHGFTPENIGCPIEIDDQGIPVEIKGHQYEVGKKLHNIDHILCLSHVKGHIATGMGGAIKNFGMGGVTKQTKKMMHHGSRPKFFKDHCTSCGICETVCPFEAISVNETGWVVHSSSCFGCGVCVENCPSDALKYQTNNLQYFLACATKACVQGKQVLYINDVNRIADSCDCDPTAKDILCPDVGYCMSTDPVAIDYASLRLIDEKKQDVFQQKLHVNPYQQIEFAEGIGIGSTEYELLRLSSSRNST